MLDARFHGHDEAHMIRKIVTLLILIPIVLAIVLFAVSNRAPVSIGFDPLAAQPPMFSFALPQYLLLLVVLIAGVIVGGIAAWMRQSRWRRRARRLSAELKAAYAEADTLRRQLESRTAPPPPPPPQSSIAAIAYRHPTAA
jgi:uncharacterized integral membrane protein